MPLIHLVMGMTQKLIMRGNTIGMPTFRNDTTNVSLPLYRLRTNQRQNTLLRGKMTTLKKDTSKTGIGIPYIPSGMMFNRTDQELFLLIFRDLRQLVPE